MAQNRTTGSTSSSSSNQTGKNFNKMNENESSQRDRQVGSTSQNLDRDSSRTQSDIGEDSQE